MKQCSICNCVIIILCASLLMSCAGSRKARTNKAISTSRKQVARERDELDRIEKKLNEKLEQQDIDSTPLRILQPKLNSNKKENERIELLTNELEAALENSENFKKNYKQVIKSKIEALDIHQKDFAHRIVNYGMINESLELTKPNVYNLGIFFGPGEYKVPEMYQAQTTQAFIPLLDSVIAVCNRYSGTKKVIYIVVKGYADEQGIDEQSSLYADLAKRFQIAHPDRQQLNLALSKLRADELGTLIYQLLKEKRTFIKKSSRTGTELYQEGYGEALPNSKITDYKGEDERRRIVTIYWYVLPIE